MLLRILIVGISASKVYFLLFSTLQIKAFFLNYFFIYYLLILGFNSEKTELKTDFRINS
jgi:hypothetical protein